VYMIWGTSHDYHDTGEAVQQTRRFALSFGQHCSCRSLIGAFGRSRRQSLQLIEVHSAR